jgi:hypothetical protein
MEKWPLSEADVRLAEVCDKNCEDTTELYFCNKEGQFELYRREELSMYQRVLSFLRDLQLSDFD